MKFKTTAAAAIAALMMAGGASAGTVILDSSAHCDGDESTQEFFKPNGASLGNITIEVEDVTGNAGGASDCWGAFKGNDSNDTGTNTDGSSNFSIGGMKYNFVSKVDINDPQNDGVTNISETVTGIDIGLTSLVAGNVVSSSGSWSVDATKFAPYGDFLISLKAANNPGYAVWLFSGTHAESTFGTWKVAWGNDLSHLSIYAKNAPVDPDDPATPIPLPAAGWLMLAGIGGLAALRRRKKA